MAFRDARFIFQADEYEKPFGCAGPLAADHVFQPRATKLAVCACSEDPPPARRCAVAGESGVIGCGPVV